MRPGGQAVAAETDGMRPRPSGFLDNKLKQRVIQVQIPQRQVAPWSAFGARGHLPGAAPTSGSTSLRPRLGSGVGMLTVRSSAGGAGPALPLWGAVSGASPGRREGAAGAPAGVWGTSAQISKAGGHSLGVHFFLS